LPATPAEEQLKSLYCGLPIAGEDGLKLLSPTAGEAVAKAAAAVDNARGHLASRQRVTVWVTGRPGNGKTQSLRQLTYLLSRTPALGKYALALVDCDKEPDANRTSGIVPAVVRKCLFTAVGISGLADVSQPATQWQQADAEKTKSIAFGADVLTSLLGLPSLSLVANRGLPPILRWMRSQKWFIRRKIQEKWPANPQLVEFLSAWATYILKPSQDNERDFSGYLGGLSASSLLLDLFGFALQSSNYTTLVLAFDEVKNDTVASLKTLWDTTNLSDGSIEQKLNLVFVLAAQESIYQGVCRSEALRRRFCDSPNVHSQLTGPKIHPSYMRPPGGRDDFDHVVDKAKMLLGDAPHLRAKPTNPIDFDLLRDRLSSLRVLTWQVLWREVIGLIVDL
jgi:hypothetical protein